MKPTPILAVLTTVIVAWIASQAYAQYDRYPPRPLEDPAQSARRTSQLPPQYELPPPQFEPPLPLPVPPPTNWQPTNYLRDPPPDFNPPGTNVLFPPLNLQQDDEIVFDGQGEQNLSQFRGNFSNENQRSGIGVDFYSPPEFEGGLIVTGENVALKIGGFVKADFIYDFDPIDSTDSFVTSEIPVGAAPRTNARYHARQTRLSFDTRWDSQGETIRIFVEGDFFGENNAYRLRHAYGEVGSILVGQTWTTFHDSGASPATLDFEGSVSSISRRQAQARLTGDLWREGMTWALAVEDTRFILVLPPGVDVVPRSPSPDFLARIRIQGDRGHFQLAHVFRVLGAQAPGMDLRTSPAWGFNGSGSIILGDNTKAYYQVLFGQGIGSYRSLPDAGLEEPTKGGLIGLFGWMVGVTHEWNDNLSSNFTYAENSLDNVTLQPVTDIHRSTYLAANLIWSPLDRVKVGAEYLYGLRENIDKSVGSANRVQVAFIFDLP